MGRIGPPADRPHRGSLPVGREPDVCGHRRPAVQATGRLPGGPAQGSPGPAGRRLHRRPTRQGRRPGESAFPGAGRGKHPLERIRPERPVVALVRAPQDLRGAARRLPLHGQSHGHRRGDQVRRVGRGHPLQAGRRTDAEDARNRVRRHERGDGRSLRRHGRTAMDRPVGSVRASRDHRSPVARRGHPGGQARQHERAEAARVARAIRLHREPGRRPGRELLLGPGGAAPQFRHRRTRPQRVLRRARQAERHDRGPDRRNLQRLQHDQDGEGALRPAAANQVRGFPRARALQSHPRVDRSRGRRHLLHGPGGAGCHA